MFTYLKNTVTTMLFLTTFLFGNSLTLSDNGDGTWAVGYSSDAAIGGFQFNVDGATILSASGGDATSSGFMISASATTVLGFSMTGTFIPAGTGILVDLGSEDCTTSSLSDFILCYIHF